MYRDRATGTGKLIQLGTFSIFFRFCLSPTQACLGMCRHVPSPMVATTPKSDRDLDAEAEEAPEAARAMPPGPAKSEAMKRAGALRKAADAQGDYLREARQGRRNEIRFRWFM
jgi:hypothetical protein